MMGEDSENNWKSSRLGVIMKKEMAQEMAKARKKNAAKAKEKNDRRTSRQGCRTIRGEAEVEASQVKQAYGSGVGAEGEHEQVDDENWSDYSGVVFIMKALMRGQAFHVVGPA